MKIALITLPRPDDIHQQRLAPPLPVGYLAAMLEQARHIVRIYDLALNLHEPLSRALAPVRFFRPHVVMLAAAHDAAADDVAALLADTGAQMVRVHTPLRDIDGVIPTVARHSTNEETVISQALGMLPNVCADLLPARHLFALERYGMRSLNDNIQTTISVSLPGHPASAVRPPAAIVDEMRVIAREHGIRAVLLEGQPLTWQREWFGALIDAIRGANLDMGWEAPVDVGQLDDALLAACKAAGCEGITIAFAAEATLLTGSGRRELAEAVALAHAHGLAVRADIALAPALGGIPALIDVAATFHLDAVQFSMLPADRTVAAAVLGAVAGFDGLIDVARAQYQMSLSRRQYVERFGTHLGPVIWRIGRHSILGAAARRLGLSGAEPTSIAA